MVRTPGCHGRATLSATMVGKKMWNVYILRCADDSLYTGITTDVNRRLKEHNEAKLGAKYTRARRPVTLVYVRRCRTRSKAATIEAALKKLSRLEKLELLAKS